MYSQFRLAKIPLRKGSKAKFEKFLKYLKDNPQDYIYEAKQKGYAWAAIFYEAGKACDYVHILSQSENWDKIKSDDEIEHGPFRKVYNDFKKECWLLEKLTEQDYQTSIYSLNTDFLFLENKV
ncbi:MAG TPA: DUF6176 family protein [Oligoflexia bacterium]|nr:DUF6176 family protein [Oligoflexia bacterium]HMR24213.1 DUF6176 family protein [Oligoflexia bacterium]